MKNTLGFLKLNDRLHADFYNMTDQEMEQLFWDTDFEPIDELTYDGYFTYCKEGEADRIEGIENMREVSCEYLGLEKYMI